jgi:thiamine biosynthesis protein ThiI
VANVSGGIDSPVAVHLMLSRGAHITVLHFDNRPYADDDEVEKARSMVDLLRGLHGDVPARLVPHGSTFHAALLEAGATRLHCVLCKRMMLRVASRYARSIGATGVVTGDSLGQVASQTLQNIVVEQQTLEGVTAVRPLIGFDKEEVVAIARRIGTYDLSIGPGTACTNAPEHPSVAARLAEVTAAEVAIDVEALVEATLDGIVEW